MTDQPHTILNIDPVEVITHRVLQNGDLEVLLKVSDRDRERLLADPHARYSLAREEDTPLVRDQFYSLLEEVSAAVSKAQTWQVEQP